MATLEERLQELVDDLSIDYKTLATWLFGTSLGTLAQLNTTDKSSFAAAINEVKAAATGAPPDATEAAKGVVQLASLLDMAAGVSGSKVATVAGVRQEREALKAEILGGVGPAADTLQELYALAQGAEETAAINDLITLVGQKADSANVYSKAAIDNMLGNTDIDLSARYQAGKTA